VTERQEPLDVLIVGAGPAGLTAAIYAGRALLRTLVVEKAIPGGLLAETDLIENWPGFEQAISARELMTALQKQAERFGAEILQDEVVRIEPGTPHRIQTPRGTFEAKAIILAPGSRPRELPAGRAAEFKGRGVSYCAICDGFFFRDKRLIEVGAGDSGLTEALFLTRFANSVSVVVRHPEDDPKAIRASAILRKRASEHPKIEFLWNCVVEEILGDGSVSAVRLRDLATGETRDHEIDGVFIKIGHDPQTEFLKGTVNLNEDGYIETDEHLRTNVPGIFAAGDSRVVAHMYAQGVVAAGEGAVAAIQARKHVSG